MVTDGNRPMLGRSLEGLRALVPASTNDHTLASAVSERLPQSVGRSWLPAAALGDRIPVPDLRAKVETSGVIDGLAPGTARNRLPASALTSHFTLPTFRTDVASRTVGDRLPSISGGGSLPAAMPTPADRPALSTPEVPIDHDGVFDREALESRLYDSTTTTPEYFVGVIADSHDSVVDRLESSQFGVSRVCYPKTLADEDLEYSAASTWVYRSWPLSHFQLHLVLFELPTDAGEEVYAFYHHEYNWLRHPLNHLEAEYLNPEWERDTTVDLLESAGLTVRTCEEIGEQRRQGGEESRRAREYCRHCGGAA